MINPQTICPFNHDPLLTNIRINLMSQISKIQEKHFCVVIGQEKYVQVLTFSINMQAPEDKFFHAFRTSNQNISANKEFITNELTWTFAKVALECITMTLKNSSSFQALWPAEEHLGPQFAFLHV